MILRLLTSVMLCACVVSVVFAQPPTKPLRAAGRVETVSQESVTISLPGDQKLVLRIDKATKVTGPGAQSRSTASDGQKVAAEVVRAADAVVVTYLGDTAGGPLATEIHVRLVAK